DDSAARAAAKTARAAVRAGASPMERARRAAAMGCAGAQAPAVSARHPLGCAHPELEGRQARLDRAPAVRSRLDEGARFPGAGRKNVSRAVCRVPARIELETPMSYETLRY